MANLFLPKDAQLVDAAGRVSTLWLTFFRSLRDSEGTPVTVTVSSVSGLVGVFDCGGSEDVGIVTGASWQPLRAGRTHELDGTALAASTVEAVVYYKTSSSGQPVQVRVRNTTTNTTAALGTASSSTSVVSAVLAVTLTAGANNYRLEVLGGASDDVFAWGFLRVR